MPGPNVVPNKLVAWPPGTPSFQNDADASGANGDSNKPQDDDRIRVTASVTGLAPDLRRIVSEFKNQTLDPVWINYVGTAFVDTTGLPNGNGIVQVPDPDPPVYDGTVFPHHVFTLKNTNGDWTKLIGIGQCVRVSYTDGSPRQFAIVGGVQVVGALTQVVLDRPVLNVNLAYVEFSGVGATAGFGGPFNAFPLTMQNIGTPASGTWVVPVDQGGTGNTTGTLPVSGAAGGDLSGTYPNPTVAKIQGQPVAAMAPVAGNILQFLAGSWEPSPGGPPNVGDILRYGVSGWAPAVLPSPTAAQLTLTTGLPGSATLNIGGTIMIVKWDVSSFNSSGEISTKTVTFATPFPTACWFVLANIIVGGVAGFSPGGGNYATWTGAATANNADVAIFTAPPGPAACHLYVIAIGN